MTEINKLKSKCIREIVRVICFFEEKYKKEIPLPKITFDKKGKAAGTCYYQKRQIKLNWDLLKQENDRFIERTPGHEAVHWCEFTLFGSSGHGKRWKSMMREVGLSDNRCHNFDVSKVSSGWKRVPWHCSCRTHMVTILLDKRMKAGQTRYCLKCKQTLKEGEKK